MKTLQIILVVSLFLFFGCSKESDVEVDCLDLKLVELEMVAFDNQEVGCNLFVELYHYRGKQYYLLGSHCADIEVYPVDCGGENLCDSGSRFGCEDFFSNAENLGIVGIEE